MGSLMTGARVAGTTTASAEFATTGCRLWPMFVAAVAAMAIAIGTGAAVGATDSTPPGFHRVNVRHAGISILVPSQWETPRGTGFDFSAGNRSTGQAVGVKVVAKGSRFLPYEPQLVNGSQDGSIATRPAKVRSFTNPAGTRTTTFYFLTKRGAVLILFLDTGDARQDPLFQTIIQSVKA